MGQADGEPLVRVDDDLVLPESQVADLEARLARPWDARPWRDVVAEIEAGE